MAIVEEKQIQRQLLTPEPWLPYGVTDFEAQPIVVSAAERKVRCFVRGCREVVESPTRHRTGSICPKHRIWCHYSTAGRTYAFAEPERNFIVDADVARRRLFGHPFKYENHRLGQERSEDALTWNVFRSFQKAGLLHVIANHLTGQACDEEPALFLWGLCVGNDSFEPWNLLIAARQRFESTLPVDRPKTEPDIALYLPGHYLILIEAKFTSSNSFYENGPRKDRRSLTKVELLTIYDDPGIRIIDRRSAREATKIYHQLWRNTVFAEWMARHAHGDTVPYIANLVRAGHEIESTREFRSVINAGFANRFVRITWEGLDGLAANQPQLETLRRYLRCKTAGLRPAFQLSD
jgi:hypothetical protein